MKVVVMGMAHLLRIQHISLFPEMGLIDRDSYFSIGLIHGFHYARQTMHILLHVFGATMERANDHL